MSLIVLGGCRQESSVKDTNPGQSVESDLGVNRLEGLPGLVYQSQVNSPIKWQPWTKESIKLARDSGRLILAVIAMPQQSTYRDVLEKLESNEYVVEDLNQNYVPILIDGDAVREICILTADLCAEIGKNLQLPLMLWLTPDVNPVAWIPLPDGESTSIDELFMQSNPMVGLMWEEDSEYVSSNSQMDQKIRRQRMIDRRENREMSDQPDTDSVKALRQLTSLYDPLSRTFDEAGGLFPAGSLDLLSMGARMEALPDDIREKSMTVLEYLLSDLLGSAMFDPLDGGVYNSRRGSSWALPGFYRDCSTQARVVVSLMEAYDATGNEKAFDRALAVLSFAEENFKTAEGLFALPSADRGANEVWLWNMGDLNPILSDEEKDVWVRATGMKEIGNLPSEVDPLREFFRNNSLRHDKSAEQIAKETGKDLKAVEELISSSSRKLLKVRDERMKHEIWPAEANSAATFRMVSAYAAAYRATGEAKFLKRAIETIEKARDHFSDGPRLKLYASDAPPSLVSARAFVYGLAITASLDVAAISLDKSWLSWADDLATTTAETFTAGDYIRECPPDADLMGLPISDMAMIFDDSSVGILSMVEARMEALGRPLFGSFASLATGLPASAISSPVLYTDVIQGSLMRAYGASLHYNSGVGEDMKTALSRVSPKVMMTLSVEVGSEDPTSEVFKISSDGTKIPISQPQEIYDRSLPRGSR